MTFQPFFFIEGMVGWGSLDLLVRQDAGYGAGAGVDWLWSKASGMTISVASQNATETSLRLWIGLFTSI